MTGHPWVPLALAAGLYIWQAGEYWALGQRGLAFAFLMYAGANVGFILALQGE